MAEEEGFEPSVQVSSHGHLANDWFQPRAEYRMLRILGADAVGMSTVPEVIVANQLNLPVIAISVLTDECDPDNLQPINVPEIMEIAKASEPKLIQLFKSVI